MPVSVYYMAVREQEIYEKEESFSMSKVSFKGANVRCSAEKQGFCKVQQVTLHVESNLSIIVLMTNHITVGFTL